MKMTPQQENAVNYRGSTILVSAGAGSGKTATLSKRIISRISDPYDPAEIDDFLIVTFTNASADDLSDKIERELTECAASDIKNVKAMRQLAKIKYANISTINSFCLGVVKKHFQLLDLPAKIRICDAAESEMLRKRIISEVLEEKYSDSSEGSAFFDAVEIFSGSKNDSDFTHLLENLHKKIMSFPEPEEWCAKALEYYDEIINCTEYNATFYGREGCECIAYALKEYISALKCCLSIIYKMPELLAYEKTFLYDCANAEDVLHKIEDIGYEDERAILDTVVKSKLSRVKGEEKAKDFIKSARDTAYDNFTEKKNLFFGSDISKIKAAAFDSRRILAELFDIISKIEEKYSAEKKERGVIDFSDAERYTYKLFTTGKYDSNGRMEISETAKKYRDTFAEIYIDEYQDINPIQDTIFRCICRYDKDGHELNRFMVGDIKQSIYRFRGARPEFFNSYLKKFDNISENDKLKTEKKEFLSNNFRCSEPVVNFTNLIFSDVMRGNYENSERLVYSKKEELKIDNPCEVIIFEEDESEDEDYYDAEIKAAAQMVMSIVDSNIGSDGKPYTYGDIAVLLPKVKKIAEKYVKYFESTGIPVYSETTENFFENPEIVLCLCILNTIDNSLRDIYVTGAMRSEIFMFSDDDLLAIRRLYPNITGTEKSMWQSVKEIAYSDIAEIELREKCVKFIDKIEKLKKFSIGASSDKLILKIYSDLHMMNVVSEKSFNRYTEKADARRENLMILYDLARNFEKTSFRGLSAFLEFLNDRAANPADVPSAASLSNSNAVRIMSIHHSKGLEFPVCILCGLSSRFSKKDEQGVCVFSDNAGIGFKLSDLDTISSSDSSTSMVKYDTPFRGAIRSLESRNMIEEQKRLLYVAMTRAKDRLVMLLKKCKNADLVSYYENGIGENSWYINSATGFYDMLYPCLCKYDKMEEMFKDIEFVRKTVLQDITNCFCVKKITVRDLYKSEKDSAVSEKSDYFENTAEKIRSRLNFAYPYIQLAEIRSKISVSDIKNGKLSRFEENLRDENKLQCPAFLITKEQDSAAVGTAVHAFMQFADYGSCEKSVEEEARRLLEQGYISGEQYSMLDLKMIAGFFKSEIYTEIKQAKNVMREYSFTLRLPLQEVYLDIDKEIPGEFMLVQGKIDCFFVDEKGKYTVVDFKTDRVKNIFELEERYSMQLDYYRRAVCEMTESNNVRMVIYSFHKNGSIELHS